MEKANGARIAYRLQLEREYRLAFNTFVKVLTGGIDRWPRRRYTLAIARESAVLLHAGLEGPIGTDQGAIETGNKSDELVARETPGDTSRRCAE